MTEEIPIAVVGGVANGGGMASAANRGDCLFLEPVGNSSKRRSAKGLPILSMIHNS